eukprot:4524815-Pyramimonas_sp.AAC.2
MAVMNTQDDAEAADFLVDALGDKAAALAAEFVGHRNALRARSGAGLLRNKQLESEEGEKNSVEGTLNKK